MSAASAVARGRVAAERLMTDTCAIERVGEVTTDDSGNDTASTVPVYSGKCRVRPDSTRLAMEQGLTDANTWRYTVSIPVSALVEPKPGDGVKITASADASLVNKRLRILAITRGSQITARRLICEEVGR